MCSSFGFWGGGGGFCPWLHPWTLFFYFWHYYKLFSAWMRVSVGIPRDKTPKSVFYIRIYANCWTYSQIWLCVSILLGTFFQNHCWILYYYLPGSRCPRTFHILWMFTSGNSCNPSFLPRYISLYHDELPPLLAEVTDQPMSLRSLQTI